MSHSWVATKFALHVYSVSKEVQSEMIFRHHFAVTEM